MRPRTKQTGVYCLTFPNGKRYVGIGMSRDGIAHRFGQYRRLEPTIRNQRALYAALVKYGPESVVYDKVLVTGDRETAERVEKQLIALWGTCLPDKGYNITHGGGGWYGCRHTDKHIERMRSINTGRKHSVESRQKMSESHKGQMAWNKGLEYPAARRKHSSEEIAKRVKTRFGDVVFSVKTPTGDTITISQLAPFCREHNLDRSHMLETLNGKRKTHKGYVLLSKVMTPVEG